MFAVGFGVLLFFNGNNMMRVNLDFPAFPVIHDYQSNSWHHGHKIRMHDWHARAVAQAEHEGFRVLSQPLTNQL